MPNKDKERTPTLITSLLQTIVPMVQLAFEAAPRLFSLTFVLLLTKSVIPIIVAWLTKLLFDELGTLDTVSAENSDYIISIVIWLGMFIILSYTFKSIETYLLDELGRKAELHLSAKLYGKLASLPGLKHFESPQFHNAIQIASQNVNWLPSEILRKTISLISSFITITVFLLVILRMSVLISLVLFIVAIPSFWMQLHFRKKRFETDTGAISIQRMANYMASILSSSHAAKEIRLFITGNFFLKKYVNFMTELNNRYRLLSKREMIGLGFINFLNAITMVGINIFAVIEFLNRKISLGDITFYLNATNSIRENLNNISWIIATLGERSLYFRY